jgi:hypothetical protein
MVDNVIHDVSYGRAKTGGGVRSVEDVAMTNCIVWGNIPDSLDVTGTVTYSVVAGGWPGEGNIDEDPQLTHDGHLTGTSPCIDRGDPAGEYPDQSDLDGEPRVLKGRVDMGADEWVDSDEDHLPDWWESHYFGDAAAAHADADEEADGRINIREYELASEPFIGPRAYYVAVTGNDAWDGRCAEWDGGTCGPKATIQAAIDACHATEGDEVRLADGTYTGTGNRALRFGGRAMTLRSASGNRSACVIDCEHQDQALLFLKGEDAASIVADITIANGHAVEAGFTDGQGGGLYCYYSGPQLRNCRITGCSAGLFGGGIACSSGGIVLRDCLIDQNEAEYDGGGLWCVVGGLVFLEGCALVDNTGYGFGTHGSCGGLYAEDCDVWLRHCTVHGNTGNSQGGIQLLYCNANMADCLITNNVGLTGVGIALVQCTMTASGLTIADNVAEWQYGGALLVSHSDTSVSHCVMWGNGADPVAYYPTMQSMTFCATEFGAGESWFGEGCIDTDPLFVDPDGPDDDPATWEDNDYRLQVESPCLDAGNPGFVLEPGAADLDGRLRV